MNATQNCRLGNGPARRQAGLQLEQTDNNFIFHSNVL